MELTTIDKNLLNYKFINFVLKQSHLEQVIVLIGFLLRM